MTNSSRQVATSRNTAMNVRLAVLETKLDVIDPRLISIEAMQKEHGILLTTMKESLDRQKGAWGVILLVVSALWALGTMLKDWLISRSH